MKTVAALVYIGLRIFRAIGVPLLVALWFFVFLLSSGCGPGELPRVLQVQDGFTEPQIEVLHDVRDEWCLAAGWCPSFHGWGSRIFAELDLEECITCDESTLGYNDGPHVHLAVRHPSMGELDRFWYTAAHEFGHWGSNGGWLGSGHTETGLLAEAYTEASRLCIDQESLDAFCDESGQCKRRNPTCITAM